MNKPMSLDARFAAKSLARDFDPKVAFALRVMSAMAGVSIRFVHDNQARWRQNRRNLAFDRRLDDAFTGICHHGTPSIRDP
jgi:hypothetical protein